MDETAFHFLRPWWLLAMVPAALLAWALWRANDSSRAWRGVIDDHLLPHLVSRSGESHRIRPLPLLVATWAIGVVAAAGPTWRRAPSPFADDVAALALVVRLTPTMEARDVQPTRLQRSVQKLGELLELRKGGRTALLAFAGSAHLVMPATRDAGIIGSYAGELSPSLMPVPEGDATGEALALAQAEIEATGQAGSILLVVDGVSDGAVAALREHRRSGGVPVHVFGVAAPASVPVPPGSPPAPPLDERSLSEAASAGGGEFVPVTPDEADVRRLASAVSRRTARAGNIAGDTEEWKDAGYWLVPLIVALSLFWFRPGWAVRWDTGTEPAAEGRSEG